MTIGVVGRKCGMTRVFTEDGVSIPVTVIEIEPNRVTQFKNEESDGYRAVQVTVGERRASRVTKAQAGHFAKASVAAGRTVLEFRLKTASTRRVTRSRRKFSRQVNWWMSPVSPRVKALPVPSNAGTSVVRTIPTVTPYPTASRALLVSARLQVVYSRARRCPGTWAPGATCTLEIVRVDAERNLLLVQGCSARCHRR
ncbi:Large ribosomal subunit protein uL3 OS=Stutzerimonas stutzeri OX=316 GN=rplC PE=3 SV=1 [Stutzerimonas stutzeri]